MSRIVLGPCPLSPTCTGPADPESDGSARGVVAADANNIPHRLRHRGTFWIRRGVEDEPVCPLRVRNDQPAATAWTRPHLG